MCCTADCVAHGVWNMLCVLFFFFLLRFCKDFFQQFFSPRGRLIPRSPLTMCYCLVIRAGNEALNYSRYRRLSCFVCVVGGISFRLIPVCFDMCPLPPEACLLRIQDLAGCWTGLYIVWLLHLVCDCFPLWSTLGYRPNPGIVHVFRISLLYSCRISASPLYPMGLGGIGSRGRF